MCSSNFQIRKVKLFRIMSLIFDILDLLNIFAIKNLQD